MHLSICRHYREHPADLWTVPVQVQKREVHSRPLGVWQRQRLWGWQWWTPLQWVTVEGVFPGQSPVDHREAEFPSTEGCTCTNLRVSSSRDVRVQSLWVCWFSYLAISVVKLDLFDHTVVCTSVYSGLCSLDTKYKKSIKRGATA